jgi:hypothetical protein
VTLSSLDDLAVGDRVWCLASVGIPFRVGALDREGQRLTVVPEPSSGSGARPLDLSSDTLWLLTKEAWDQVWYWPDRAGESFETVVQRFIVSHQPGDVVQGYFLDTSVGALNQGFVKPNPKTAMLFEIQRPTPGFGQVRVKPVIETPDGIVAVGPNVPLRLAMTCYRWSLSFGELIVNWRDFLGPDGD